MWRSFAAQPTLRMPCRCNVPTPLVLLHHSRALFPAGPASVANLTEYTDVASVGWFDGNNYRLVSSAGNGQFITVDGEPALQCIVACAAVCAHAFSRVVLAPPAPQPTSPAPIHPLPLRRHLPELAVQP